MADLHVGLTLVKLALEARPGSDKRRRNTTNARKALVTVMRIRNGLIFMAAQERQLNNGLAKLKSALEQLGESF